MTGAEYIADFLARNGMKHIFAVTGGAIAFVVDACCRHPDLKVTFMQHEQACAMAADAIWRVTEKPGVTLSTSGPGAVNLLTGIACSYFDYIPSLHITGQVPTREWDGTPDQRQNGFQQTDIVKMASPISRALYCQTITSLAEALRATLGGFNGPFLIDVPMDIQQADVH